MNIKKAPPPDPPKPPSQTKEQSEQKSAPLDQTEAPYRPFQAAYDEYFQNLCKVSEEAQRRILDAQFEYQRALHQAWQSQDEKGLQEANENFQRTLETAANDTTPLKRYADAYEEYKDAVQKAFANAKGAEFEPITLSAIAHTISIVAHAASQIPRPPQQNE
jgi:hypothetical protein